MRWNEIPGLMERPFLVRLRQLQNVIHTEPWSEPHFAWRFEAKWCDDIKEYPSICDGQYNKKMNLRKSFENVTLRQTPTELITVVTSPLETPGRLCCVYFNCSPTTFDAKNPWWHVCSLPTLHLLGLMLILAVLAAWPAPVACSCLVLNLVSHLFLVQKARFCLSDVLSNGPNLKTRPRSEIMKDEAWAEGSSNTM